MSLSDHFKHKKPIPLEYVFCALSGLTLSLSCGCQFCQGETVYLELNETSQAHGPLTGRTRRSRAERPLPALRDLGSGFVLDQLVAQLPISSLCLAQASALTVPSSWKALPSDTSVASTHTVFSPTRSCLLLSEASADHSL